MLMGSARAFFWSTSAFRSVNDFGSFGPNETRALAVLSPIVDEMLGAHERGDYDAFSRLATSEFRQKVTEARFRRAFREIAPTLGTRMSTRFLSSSRIDGDPVLHYAAAYSEADEDVLIRVRFRNASTPPAIAWMWIE
ncbi:MAG: hypothetical protein Rubg2KO_38250 [Rubricoccaceae bacterium]